MKTKTVWIFIIFFFFKLIFLSGCLKAQFGVTFDSTTTTLLNSYLDSNNNSIRTYIRVPKCIEIYKFFTVFSLKNDKLHGDFFRFSNDGTLEEWFEFKDGLLWNIFINSDSLYRGEMTNGTGYINSYVSDNYLYEKYGEKHFLLSRKYFLDGLPYRIIGFRKNGVIMDYSNISKLKIEFRSDTITINWGHHLCEQMSNRNSDTVISYYTDIDYYEYPIYYLNSGLFVVAYTLESASDFFYYLTPEEYFIPEFLQNKYNLKKFKKLKKKLIKAYSECNGVAECYFPEMEKYYKKYFKEKK